MQLAAIGHQDVYLTSSPQITFWKIVYRRHSNFTLESIEQTFNGSASYDRSVNVTISRNGDLATEAWLEVTLKRGTGTTPTYYVGEQLLKDVTMEIGGQRIDRHYSTWYRIYDELYRSANPAEKQAYRECVDFTNEAAGYVKRLYIPLQFWWNKNPGLALPLIALQYHECKINFNFAPASEIDGIDVTYQPNISLFIDYIYLDQEERARFAAVSHEYLIEQLQFTGAENVSIGSTQKNQNVRLNLNHPVKLLSWVAKGPGHGQFAATSNVQQYGMYDDRLAPLRTFKLQLNGLDRFSERRGRYFNRVVPLQRLQSIPSTGIYAYSFALHPASLQPSGSCNMSRIDNCTAQFSWKAANKNTLANVMSEEETVDVGTQLTELHMYAVNYNVFRVTSGMGGLTYAT